MNEKQNELFSGNENQNQQYEIEVTIKPSKPIISTTQNEQPKETPNISHLNMAGNLKMNQNSPQSNNSQLYAQKKDTPIINLQSKVNIPTNFSNNSSTQKNVSKTNFNSSIFNPVMISFFSKLREANKLKNANQQTPNLLQQVINTLKPQAASEVQQQSTNSLNKPTQPPLNMLQQKPIQQSHPESAQPSQIPNQQTFSQPNLYDQHFKISGYRMNQDQQIEYEYFSTKTPNSNHMYCSSTQFSEFEPIRQFWLHHNGYDEKNPRQAISSPKRKKRRTSYIDYSSDSNSPPRKLKSSQKLDEKESSLKIADSDLPPMLSFDKEPKVNIFGVVQKEPVIKIAVQFEKSQILTVITAAEARKKFPMQLSKFYEQFITFIDYE